MAIREAALQGAHRALDLPTLVFAISMSCVLVDRTRDSQAADPPQSPAAKEAPIQVPPGFVVERVAGPPLVEHPMMAGFDERGRLFIAESAGHNLPGPQLLKDPPNFIRLLEPADASGRFTKSSIFADKMTFPMGALWHDGSLYTTGAPSIWRLQDTKGTGVADQRQALATGFSFVGNGADIHGPFLGPDGWLYWTKGRHAHDLKLPGNGMKGKAARIFRCRPDGSGLEAVCGGGMDDPVEIAFTPEGEAIATVDILIGAPRRIDALIYCIEGGVYPHAQDVLKEFKHTGDLLPAVSNLGWVAPSGLMRYRGTAFGPDYQDNLFSAQFNRHRVQRHILERDGATFRARDEDFLVSTDPDFHPTDVLEDADGSLLVIDTGGWFRIGCPTSQIAKAEIKGAIYRVRRQDAPKQADPRGLGIKWDRTPPEALVELLDDSRFVVRDRAVQQLAKEGKEAFLPLIHTMNKSKSVRARRNAVWAATRIDKAPAARLAAEGLNDKDPSVRIAAAHSVGLRRDDWYLPRLLELAAADPSPAVRREVATALGRIKKPEAVKALFEGRRGGGDRFLEHAQIYALIEIADREATLKGLRDPSPRVRRGAVIALDQMDGGNLTRDLVVPLLDTDDAALHHTVMSLIIARPDWAGEVLGLLCRWLAQADLPEGRRETLRSALLAFGKDPAIQELVGQALTREQTPLSTRLLLLEMMAQTPLDKLPTGWVRELGRALEYGEERIERQAVATIRARAIQDFDESLHLLADDPARAADLRVAALATAAPRLAGIEAPLFEFLLTRLDPNLPPLARLAAAEALGNARLSDIQLEALVPKVANAGALEMVHLVAAYERSKSAPVGKKLVEALDKSPGLSSLPPEILRRSLQAYPAEVQQAAEPLLKRLQVDTDKQNARLAELEPVLAGGDALRGRDVFFGKKAACTTCHTIQNDGGRVGPDLTKIGSIRTGRDLLEAVVFPSASIVRGYEPYLINTSDGRVHNGIIGRQTPEAIFLITADRTEIRIARSTVDTIERSPVSIMPQGLDAQLTRQELGDLIAYLQSLR